MVSNSGFGDKTQTWHAMGNRSRYGVVQKAGRGGGACLRYRKQKDETPNENSHYDQIVAVEPNATYTAGAWFKSDGVLRPVIRIATADWQTIAVVTVPVPKKDGAVWQQAKAAFATGQRKQIRFQIFGGARGEIRQTTVGTSYCDDAFVRKATAEERRAMCRARVAVDAKAIARELNPLFFGVNALFMVEDDAALADEGLARYLREMPCRLIRYPGGEMADNYHWKTHRLHDPKHWPFRQGPDTTDTDEVMRWCRRIGAEPIFVVNLESAFVQGDIEVGVREAAEWVRYCNKEKGYNVKYWEIGNETYLFGTYYPLKAYEYADAVARFSRAMKAVDPTIKIGAIGPLGPTQIVTMEFVPDVERENVRKMGKQKRREFRTALMKKLGANRRGDAWWPTVVNAAGDAMDFAVVHRYHPNVFGPDINADKPVAALRRFLREQIPNREIPVALTEWNLSRNAKVTTLGHALALAELIGDYLAGGVDLATFWPLRPTGKSSSFRAMFDRDSNRSRPAYEVMKLFSSRIDTGTQLVQAASSNVAVYARAVLSRDRGRLTVFLVNRSDWQEGAEVEIAAEGFTASLADAVSLAAPTLDSEDIMLVGTELSIRAGKIEIRLPPHSLTAVDLRQRNR